MSMFDDLIKQATDEGDPDKAASLMLMKEAVEARLRRGRQTRQRGEPRLTRRQAIVAHAIDRVELAGIVFAAAYAAIEVAQRL